VDLPELAVGGGWKASGKLETDFFNAFVERSTPQDPDHPAGPNNPAPAHDLVSNSRAALRVRHAYVRVAKYGWHLLAGQTWDVISPLFPSLNADTVMWNAGNTGDRRPQLRVGFETTRPERRWSFAGMIGSSGAVDGQDLDGDGYRDGETSGKPTWQARIGHSALSHIQGKRWSVGLYGHYARQSFNRLPLSGRRRSSSRLGGIDFSLPLTERAVVQGELWAGRNLSDVRGGIGQGINIASGAEIGARGGWLEASYQAQRRYQVNVGATLDRADSGDLTFAGARTRNRTYFVTQRFSLGEKLSLGFDYAHWETRFKALPAGRNHRFTLFLQNGF
jgi:hypothetical protein